MRERIRPRHHEILLPPRREFEAEQHREQNKKKNEEANHDNERSERALIVA
jgi:hypothetical protein